MRMLADKVCQVNDIPMAQPTTPYGGWTPFSKPQVAEFVLNRFKYVMSKEDARSGTVTEGRLAADDRDEKIQSLIGRSMERDAQIFATLSVHLRDHLGVPLAPNLKKDVDIVYGARVAADAASVQVQPGWDPSTFVVRHSSVVKGQGDRSLRELGTEAELLVQSLVRTGGHGVTSANLKKRSRDAHSVDPQGHTRARLSARPDAPATVPQASGSRAPTSPAAQPSARDRTPTPTLSSQSGGEVRGRYSGGRVR